jgi:hypothetical protein
MAGNNDLVLPSTLQVQRLDEVAQIIDSLHKTPNYVECGRPVVRVTDALDCVPQVLENHAVARVSRMLAPSRAQLEIEEFMPSFTEFVVKEAALD